jgi:hypothetical protein
MKVPYFWSRWATTRPLPSSIRTAEALAKWGKTQRVIGFNGQAIRAFILQNLARRFECTRFVETGTSFGHTAGYVNRAFGLPVISCELTAFRHWVSRLNLAPLPSVRLHQASSPDFLRRVLPSVAADETPMVYLDAHWYEYLPLEDELEILAELCPRAVVAIDDFHIPHRPGFAFDEYPGKRLDVDLIRGPLASRRSDVVVMLSDYDPAWEPPAHPTGMAVVLLGIGDDELDERFPLDLLRRVQL